MNKKIIVAAAVLVAVMAGSVSAQVVYGQPAAAAVRVDYTSWNIDSADAKQSVTQVHFPVKAFVPLADNTELLLYFSGAKSTFEPADGSSIDLSGMGDARLQLNRSLAGDQLLVSLGVGLPLGKKKLAFEDEAQVLAALARDYLSLPTRRMGEGLGLSLLAGGARMVGPYRCRAGVSYQYNGKYEPYDGVKDYDPGDALSATVGADRQLEASAYYVDFSWTLYTKDKLDGTEVFKQSTQLAFGAGYTLKAASSQLRANAGFLVRGRNSTFTDTKEAQSKLYGNEFWVTLGYTRQMQDLWSITPMLEFKSIAANENQLDAASIFGLGLSAGRKLSESMGLSFGGKFYSGKADGGELTLKGLQFNLGLTANL
ncbi:MAG: hypothetical protein ABIE70_02445 [bacterium]